MDELKTIIEDTLDIPYVGENQAVYDGSYAIEPWMSSALVANGGPVNITDNMTIKLFYSEKSDAINAVHSLWVALAENHIAVESPSYEWSDQADMWTASLNIEK